MSETISRFDADELEALLHLSARVFCDYRDPRRGPFEIAYVFSETSDNEDSALMCAADLARSGQTRAIGICDGDTMHGYEGFGHSLERLKTFGYPDRIPVIKVLTDKVNTRTEADALFAHVAARRGDVAIVAPPFHLLRAFMTTVTVLQQGNTNTRVYAVPGMSLPWNVEVRHSQGVLTNTRSGLLADELARLKKYQAPEYGSLATAEQVHRYLDWRDT